MLEKLSKLEVLSTMFNINILSLFSENQKQKHDSSEMYQFNAWFIIVTRESYVFKVNTCSSLLPYLILIREQVSAHF